MRSAAPIDRRVVEDCVRNNESADAVVRCLRLRLAKQGNGSDDLRVLRSYRTRRTQRPFSPAVLLGMVITHELGHFFGLENDLGGIMLPGFRQKRNVASLIR